MEGKYIVTRSNDELQHHGIKGQKWGIRRFQNSDGSLTPAGRKRYEEVTKQQKTAKKELTKEEKIDRGKKFITRFAIRSAVGLGVGLTVSKVIPKLIARSAAGKHVDPFAPQKILYNGTNMVEFALANGTTIMKNKKYLTKEELKILEKTMKK